MEALAPNAGNVGGSDVDGVSRVGGSSACGAGRASEAGCSDVGDRYSARVSEAEDETELLRKRSSGSAFVIAV